jgi:dienelactone hydrolase
MRTFSLCVSALLFAASSGEAASVTPSSTTIPISAFSALPALQTPLLSPDGLKFVARQIRDGVATLIVIDADRPDTAIKALRIGKTDITALRWAGSQRLLMTILSKQKLNGGEEIPFLRLVSIDAATGLSRVVDTKSRGIYAGDVLYAAPGGDWALVASQDDMASYPSVKRVDLATGIATRIEKARDGVWDWYADDEGVVRAGVSYEGREWTVWYRDVEGQPLKALRGKVAKQDDSSIDRFIFGRSKNAWVLSNEKTGRFAVYKYDVATGQTGETVFERPDVDVDDVFYDGITGSIDGFQYTDDRYRTHWLDPERASLQTKLDRALPGAVNKVTGYSRDEKRVLVWSGGASDPGTYYLLDRKSMKMHPVLTPNEAIDPAMLAPVRSVEYRSRDGLKIPAYLTVPPGSGTKKLPLIVLPHGGPFLRDAWDYDPMVQFLANRGYAVLQPQFRGSTGYGRDFVSKGYGEFGKKMQDDLDDGVDFLVRSRQVDPTRVCMVGGSYGGYASLWAAVRNPERYRCAVSIAGVSDLKAQLRYDRKLFSATRYFRAWRTKVGGEGKVDLSAVSPITFVGKLKMPLLIVHGEDDNTVPASQSHKLVEAMAKSNPNVTSTFYKGGGHSFSSAADFDDFLKRLELFLAKNNPA